MLVKNRPELSTRVSSHTQVSLLLFDPVSVTSTMIGGAYLLFLLGAITWTIITLVWIVCTAVVSRINPLSRRIVIVKYDSTTTGK